MPDKGPRGVRLARRAVVAGCVLFTCCFPTRCLRATAAIGASGPLLSHPANPPVDEHGDPRPAKTGGAVGRRRHRASKQRTKNPAEWPGLSFTRNALPAVDLSGYRQTALAGSGRSSSPGSGGHLAQLRRPQQRRRQRPQLDLRQPHRQQHLSPCRRSVRRLACRSYKADCGCKDELPHGASPFRRQLRRIRQPRPWPRVSQADEGDGRAPWAELSHVIYSHAETAGAE